jgi:hypothetical protein
MDDKTKFLAFAHFHIGRTARETSEILNVPYTSLIKLRKQFDLTKDDEVIAALFNADEVAFHTFIELAKANACELTGELLTVEQTESLDAAIDKIGKGVQGLAKLETELQDTATIVARSIRVLALTSESADSIVKLADALAKIQTAFFSKGTNVQIANFNGTGGTKFEEYLSE